MRTPRRCTVKWHWSITLCRRSSESDKGRTAGAKRKRDASRDTSPPLGPAKTATEALGRVKSAAILNTSFLRETGPPLYLAHVIVRSIVYELAKSRDFVLKTSAARLAIIKKIMTDYPYFSAVATQKTLGKDGFEDLCKRVLALSDRGDILDLHACVLRWLGSVVERAVGDRRR